MEQIKKRAPKRNPHDEYQTTIENVKKDDFFVVLRSTKKGMVRSKKLYIYKGYCRFNKKYAGDHNDNISGCSYFKKGRQVIANPDC
jgi:hypothetical protein